jgi:hypothetical protein
LVLKRQAEGGRLRNPQAKALTLENAGSIRPVTILAGERMAVHESDEWINTLRGMKVRYSYQLLTTGFSASAEILEPVHAAMIYTHTHVDVSVPANRAQIEAEFADELANKEAQVASSAMGNRLAS